MKKSIIISFSFILSLLTTAAQNSKTLTSFGGVEIHGLIVGGAFDVQLSQGEQTGVTIEIREDAVSKLSVVMTDDKCVRISFADDITKYFIDKKKPLARVVVSRLDYLNLSGNVSLIAKGKFSSYRNFSVLMSGTSFASFVDIQCDNAALDINGRATVEDCTIRGANIVDVSTSESANVSCDLLCASLMLRSELASKITVIGTVVNKAKIYSSGTSKITALELKCPVIDASVIDMSRVNAKVTGVANIEKSSLAVFRYTGSGQINGNGARPM